ncbi:RNA-directed DNA polymerase, eukaryota, reverse transcriptase zinc-binding domain protein [Tanacetum coccineum]
MLTQELIREYNRKGGAKRCSLKIDIAKAYDTMDLVFLETILGKFGIPKKMIEWIMTCVTSTSFTICINGDRNGYFKGGMGLTYGDPISPNLFTLIMKVYTLMMERNIQGNPQFKYHFGCKDLKLTHIYFVDDLLVLSHGDEDSVRIIKKILEEFSNASGLLLNTSKSTILLAMLTVILGLCIKSTVKEIDKVLKGFLWCSRDLKRWMAKTSWKTVCSPKCQGGLGLKNLGSWSESLLAKHIWNIVSKKDSLWVTWLHMLRPFIIPKIGNGRDASKWYDTWESTGPLNNVISKRGIYYVGLSDKSDAVSFYTLFQAFRKLLEEIHVTWAHLEKKRTRLQTLHQSLLKNYVQCLETASLTLATASEPPRDGVRNLTTVSEHNRLKETLRRFGGATASKYLRRRRP